MPRAIRLLGALNLWPRFPVAIPSAHSRPLSTQHSSGEERRGWEGRNAAETESGEGRGSGREGGETAGPEQGKGRGGEGPRAQTRRPQLPLSAHPPPPPSKITLLFLRFIVCQKKERPFGLLKYRFTRPLCVSACLCSSREAAGGKAPAGRGTRILPAAREEGVLRDWEGTLCCRRSPSKGPALAFSCEQKC